MRHRSPSHTASRYQFQKPQKAMPSRMHTESKTPKEFHRSKHPTNTIIMDKLNISLRAKPTPKAIPAETPSRRSIIKKRHRLPKSATPVLTPLQKLTCFLAAMQCLNMIVEVSAGPTSRQQGEERVREICTSRSISSPNKPPSVRIGYSGKQLAPVSCITDWHSPKCHNHINLFNADFNEGRVIPLHPTLAVERNKFYSHSRTEKLSTEANKIGSRSKLTPTQLEKFNKYVSQIIKFTDIKAAHDYTARIGMGNCGEHTNYNLYKLLKACDSIKKLQQITVSHGKQNHVFIIVNGKAEDINISDNPKKVQAYLDRMDGDYCDTWNDGLYQTSIKAKEFYNKWHSIEVKTIPFEFDLTDLPKKAARFIQKMLNDLDLGHLAKTPATKEELTATDDNSGYRPGY